MEFTNYIDAERIFFTTNIAGISYEQLRHYAIATMTSIDDYRQGDRYFVPSTLLSGLTRYLVAKLYAENKTQFPLKNCSSMSSSVNGTRHNRIFIDENLVVKIQPTLTKPQHKKCELTCKIQVHREGVIVLQGVYTLHGEKNSESELVKKEEKK